MNAPTVVDGSAVTATPRDRARRERTRRRASQVTAALGVLGLLSALSPPLRDRLAVLLEVLPVVVPRTAVLTLVFVSVALVLTARGLRRGHRAAWTAAELLLVASVVLHLTKGLDVEEAGAAVVGAAWLAARRRAFRVLPTRTAAVRSAILGALGTVGVVGASLLLAVPVPRRGLPAHDVAGALADRAAGVAQGRFTDGLAAPALAAAAVGLLVATAWVLLRPRVPEPLTGEAHRRERERAREIVARYGGDSLDYFALRDDKQWFFTGRSVVAHAVRGSVCVVSPDPVGPAEERTECWTEFVTYAERQGWSVAVLGAGEGWLDLYEATGLRPLYLGDEALVDCRTFALDGHEMKSVRRAHRRVEAAGFTASFHAPADVDPATREQLLALARQGRRGDSERGFSMTLSRLLDPADPGVLVSVARDRAGRPVAFVQWVPATRLPGWSLDVMRRSTDPDLPNGVMDFLVVETIRHAREVGAGVLGLNFAMWRRTAAEVHGAGPAATVRLGRPVVRWLSRHAQIESLARFNAKYAPRWVPRFAAVTADLLPAQVLAIAGAEGLVEVPRLDRVSLAAARGRRR